MLLSLYDFQSVCKLNFVHILLPWECTSLYLYIFTQFFLIFSPPSIPPFLHWLKFAFSPPFMLSIDWIVLPLFGETTVVVGLISVFAGIALNRDLWLSLVAGATGVDLYSHMESC